VTAGLLGDVRRMVNEQLKPYDRQIEQTGRIPKDALDAIRKMGLFGCYTPARYGGLGLDLLSTSTVIEEIARAHIAYFYTYSMNVHIASKGIELYGSERQRKRWLPGLASGRQIGCFALTEERAGSDAAAVATTAAPDGDGYVLAGRKRYITNAPIADLAIVLATRDPAGGKRAISAFVVEKGTPGFRTGEVSAMAGGHGALQAEIVLDNCRIPRENLLTSNGFALAMESLDIGRVCWAAYSVGAASQLIDMARAHLLRRHQFGRPLAANQGLRWMIADMVAQLHAARLVTHDAAVNYDRRSPQRTMLAATAKLIASEMVGRVADATMQLSGGEGYRTDRPVERIWREVRAIRILEGTSEIMRNIIARDTLREPGP
jgi:acyl-CoA dehydrogenase